MSILLDLIMLSSSRMFRLNEGVWAQAMMSLALHGSNRLVCFVCLSSGLSVTFGVGSFTRSKVFKDSVVLLWVSVSIVNPSGSVGTLRLLVARPGEGRDELRSGSIGRAGSRFEPKMWRTRKAGSEDMDFSVSFVQLLGYYDFFGNGMLSSVYDLIPRGKRSDDGSILDWKDVEHARMERLGIHLG
ncbi:hypothetical protein L1887_28726 [Cichorium endivia]|nr:hypothetical protein L1887_28726 [Cichorium endivia]